ncbi:MAG: NTP transferase domain-containing protein [Candidatus Promineifilaceae bacterium]
MDCVIVAGGIPGPEDPLYPYTQGKPKAMLEIRGRTLIEYVAAAFHAAQQVENITIVGLGSDRGLHFPQPIQHVPDQGGMIRNAIAGIEAAQRLNPSAQNLILSTTDIPLITGAMIDEWLEQCRPFDHLLYHTFVPAPLMQARFPGSKRTFTKLKGMEITGGDVILVQPRIIHTNQELWHAAANARKQAWKLARLVGFTTLFKLLTHRLSLPDLEAIGQRLLGSPVKIILARHAELGMDGDKPHQVELIRAEFSRDA